MKTSPKKRTCFLYAKILWLYTDRHIDRLFGNAGER